MFEIWKDGNCLNQFANANDQQKWLEQNVLKMNYKSFTQIVILGSTNFVPTTSDVEYYFDFFEDYNADAKIVCAGEKYFNRDSYSL